MKIAKSEWRLIIDPPGNGPWNMAVDEAILEFVAKKKQQPSLRLYSWKPYCLSLGHAQSITDVDMLLLKKKGWDLVRRPTGGKAILHADELTYSICAPQDEPRVSGTVLESYQRLAKALLTALHLLGIEADSKPKAKSSRNKIQNAICFEVSSDYEITFNNKKIIGSAQARRLQGVLQHGAIPLFGDISRITEVLKYPSRKEKEEEACKLKIRACTIQSILSYTITWQQVSQAVIAAFESELDIVLLPSRLSIEEMHRAQELVETKYDNNEWSMRI